MFIGEYTYAVDAKGRLAIPVAFRRELGLKAVVTRGLDQALFLYPQKVWQGVADRLSKLPIAKATTRAFARLLLAGAFAVTFDRQGRIVLPDALRQFARIHKKAVLAGLSNRIEIWDAATWQRYKRQTEAKSNAIAETLGDLGV